MHTPEGYEHVDDANRDENDDADDDAQLQCWEPDWPQVRPQ